MCYGDDRNRFVKMLWLDSALTGMRRRTLTNVAETRMDNVTTAPANHSTSNARNTSNATVCLSVCLSMWKITQERVDGWQPNLVSNDKGDPLEVLKVWCWSGSGCRSRITFLFLSTLSDNTFDDVRWLARWRHRASQWHRVHSLLWCGDMTAAVLEKVSLAITYVCVLLMTGMQWMCWSIQLLQLRACSNLTSEGKQRCSIPEDISSRILRAEPRESSIAPEKTTG